MTPEELAAYREWVCIMEFKRNSWPCMALDHIDQQAVRIAELDDAVSGPLENIAKMLETVNEDMIFSGIIQTWKNENDTLKTRIAELEAQVTTLKKIAEEERAKYNLSWKDCAYRAPDTHCEKTHDYCSSVYCPLLEEQKTEANRQLAEEHPEAFR